MSRSTLASALGRPTRDGREVVPLCFANAGIPIDVGFLAKARPGHLHRSPNRHSSPVRAPRRDLGSWTG